MKKIFLLLVLMGLNFGSARAADLWKTSFDDVKEGRAAGLEFLSGQWQIKQAQNPNKTVNQFLSQTGSSSANAGKGNGAYSIALLQNYPDFEAGIFYARIRLNGDKDVNGGLVLRYINPNDFFYVGFSQSDKKIALYRVRGKKADKIIESQTGVEANKWVGLRLLMRGNRLKVEVNGMLALQFSEPDLARVGGIGFCTQGQTRGDFDNVIVAPIKSQP